MMPKKVLLWIACWLLYLNQSAWCYNRRGNLKSWQNREPYYDWYESPTSYPTARPTPRPSASPSAHPTLRPKKRPRYPTPPPQMPPLNVSPGGTTGLVFACIGYVATVGATLYIYYYSKSMGFDLESYFRYSTVFRKSFDPSDPESRETEVDDAMEPRPSWGQEMQSFFRRNPFQRPTTTTPPDRKASNVNQSGFASLYHAIFSSRSESFAVTERDTVASQPPATPQPNNSDSNRNRKNDKYAKWGRRILEQNPFRQGAAEPVPYYRESLTKGTESL